MKTYINPDKLTWSELLKRPTQTVDDIETIVNQVFKDVQVNGDVAVAKYTAKFDNVNLASNDVSKDEIKKANEAVSDELKTAIQLAKSNIERFHAAQKTPKVVLSTMVGVECWQEKRPQIAKLY